MFLSLFWFLSVSIICRQIYTVKRPITISSPIFLISSSYCYNIYEIVFFWQLMQDDKVEPTKKPQKHFFPFKPYINLVAKTSRIWATKFRFRTKKFKLKKDCKEWRHTLPFKTKQTTSFATKYILRCLKFWGWYILIMLLNFFEHLFSLITALPYFAPLHRSIGQETWHYNLVGWPVKRGLRKYFPAALY